MAMQETKYKSQVLIQPQDAVLGNTISGGKIAKEAVEIAWISGYMYT